MIEPLRWNWKGLCKSSDLISPFRTLFLNIPPAILNVCSNKDLPLVFPLLAAYTLSPLTALSPAASSFLP